METTPDTFGTMFFGYSVIFGCIVVYVLYLAKKVSKLK